ncbi:MAG TPA: LysR substrate-binding domain-containing protein [Nocardioidaceae bacterium]|nr:LysR substrate-binding domain-containing protein [Nocardioidaceae bacterium]
MRKEIVELRMQRDVLKRSVALWVAGLGIALVPRLGRGDLADELVALATHDPVPTRDIVAVHRRSMADSPAVQAVPAAPA